MLKFASSGSGDDMIHFNDRTAIQVHQAVNHSGTSEGGEILRPYDGFLDPFCVEQIPSHGTLKQGGIGGNQGTVTLPENDIANGCICNITILNDQDFITISPHFKQLL